MVFEAQGANAFLDRSMALGLTGPQIQALEDRTEGWPAGLHMAAVSLIRHSDAGKFVQSFTGSHRLVQDYLLEEVLQRQPAAIQEFLLRTSAACALACPSQRLVRRSGQDQAGLAPRRGER
jgi:LuxR family maltose regulon positive regulatory protein